MYFAPVLPWPLPEPWHPPAAGRSPPPRQKPRRRHRKCTPGSPASHPGWDRSSPRRAPAYRLLSHIVSAVRRSDGSNTRLIILRSLNHPLNSQGPEHMVCSGLCRFWIRFQFPGICSLGCIKFWAVPFPVACTWSFSLPGECSHSRCSGKGVRRGACAALRPYTLSRSPGSPRP